MSSLFDALQNRRSTRRFLDRPVEKAALERILISARRAPSGANLQPGFVHLISGDPLDRLSQRLCDAFDQSDKRPEEYDYFPQPMPAYLKARQREVGYGLYNSLGIARRDIPGRLAQHRRNFKFFNAPVGLIITIERAMGKGCYMDLGMFIQSMFLAAQGEGVDSCGIGALASYPHVIRDQLTLADNDIVVCGMALGYGDPNAPENQFQTQRASLDEYSRFLGF
jgi:nitroreductase